MKQFLVPAVFRMVICMMSICIPVSANSQALSIQEKLTALEKSTGGRLGISAINTANNTEIEYRAEERFPMNCTSKVLGVSAILKKSMTDSLFFQQRITYNKKDLALAGWAPVAQQHLDEGMTVYELSGAAIMQSDSLAMNVLIKKLGGLKIINDFLRSIGDKTSRFDRDYPGEASSIPGDLRDTSTPSAMKKSFQRLVLGDVLAVEQRKQLQDWLKQNTTGDTKIRAGVPKDWVVGDKTGQGDYGTANDIAVIWPGQCAPLIIAIYFTQSKKEAVHHETIHALATRMIIDEFAKTDSCMTSYQNKKVKP